jgi:licheninase
MIKRWRAGLGALLAAGVVAAGLVTVATASAQVAPPTGQGTPVTACSNPVLNRDLGGWGRHAGGASAPARVSVAKHVVAASGAWLSGNGANPAFYLPHTTVAPGQVWTYGIDSWTDSAGSAAKVRVDVDWYSAGGYVGHTDGTAVPVPSGPAETWTRSASDFTVPATAIRAQVTATLLAPAGASWIATACDYRPKYLTTPPTTVPPTTVPPTTNPPVADVTISAVPRDGAVLVNWATTRTDITGWTVGRNGVDIHGTGAWSTEKLAADRSHDFTSLVNGTNYTFTLTPHTAAGDRPAVTVQAVPTGTTGPPPLAGWTYTFNDDFTGTALDTTKWTAVDSGVTPESYGLGGTCFDPAQVAVAGGNLVLSADRVATPETCPGGDWGPREFSSGMIWTNDKFSQREGRFEVRMQTPDLKGAWPAFWTWSQSAADDNVWSEIDVMEAYDYGSFTDVAPNLHDVGNINPPTNCAVANFNTAMHTYAVEWTATSIKMIYDGTVCHEFTGWTSTSGGPPAPFNRAHYLILNLTVGMPFGTGGETRTVPEAGWTGSDMLVDYVRAWTPTPAPPTTTPPATTTAAPTTTPPPAGVCPTATMAGTLGLGAPRFTDNFDRTTMGPGWGLYDGEGHGGNGTRDPEAFSVDGSRARITGTAGGSSGGAALQGQPMYRDHIETCMRASAGDEDYHPVLLLWPDAEDWPVGGEVDYSEIFAPNRVGVNFFLHYGASNSQTHGAAPSVDAKAYHNYGMAWDAGCIRGYIDGVKFFEDCNTSHLPPRAMHATIQLDAFDKDTGFIPSTMDVESLKIWDGA